MTSATGTTMLAARWHGRRDVRVEEVPIPEPGPDQALVAVEWCGICGTDLEEYREGPVNVPQGATALIALCSDTGPPLIRMSGLGASGVPKSTGLYSKANLIGVAQLH